MKIPEYSELTDSQRNIANLPPVSNYVVTGEPGTGKTVIALYMAKNFAEQGKNVLFLIHNRPLKQFIDSQIFGMKSGFSVQTFDSWINQNYWNMCHSTIPTISGNYDYVWSQILDAFSNIPKQYDYIIFDEAQDFSLITFEAVSKIAGNIACFMDPNQAFIDDSAGVEELLDVLDVRNEYTLQDNFRNTKEIFDFARLYGSCTNIAYPEDSGRKPQFIKVPDYDIQNERIAEIVNEHSDARTIAIFANSIGVQRTYDTLKDSISDKQIFLYNPKNKNFRDLNFSKSGIYIMPYNLVKGLEFDVVINTRCEQIKRAYGGKAENLFYVACTRAKKALYCMYFAETTMGDSYVDVFGPLSKNRDLVDWSE